MARDAVMPRISLVNHIALLLVLSILVFPNVFGGTTPHVGALSWVAVGLAVVLAITEVFSGSRWTALVVLCAAVVGLVVVRADDAVAPAGLWAWGIAWSGVVLWFAVLASRARSNR